MADFIQNTRMREKQVRLFIALLLPDELKARLGDLINELRPLSGAIKWVDQKNLHLTLKFIGERPESDIDRIIQILTKVIEGYGKMTCPVRGTGGFPNLRNPRVIWVGLEETATVAEIARLLNKKLQNLGIKKENKAFSPHLTLGRIKKRDNFAELADHMESLNFDAGPVILDRVALVKSTLTPQGPVYENIKVFELE